MKKDNELLKITFDLALEIMEFTEELESKRKFIFANQVLKSGTSIGANSREAQGAESKADFIHKLKIAYKEAEETSYWLSLCKASKNYPTPTGGLFKLLDSSLKLLGKIISTSKRNIS